MQKVAFFVNNPSLPNKDYTSIDRCNPGIAGSEYEFLLVSYLLQNRENGIDPYLLVNFEGVLPHKNIIKVNNLDDSCKVCVENEIFEVVVDIKSLDFSVLDHYADKLSIIVWAHNTVMYSVLDKLANKRYIKKIVNVGREQMELYRDHMATLKSTYVYNIFPIQSKEYYQSRRCDHDNHNVVYMGSLIKTKGFHVLAKAWKSILLQVPDAQLYVIGSGKLYDRNASLGKYNIASEDYEKEFIPYVTNDNGEIFPSVHFLGILSDEKYDVMGRCKVGVPNPTGASETFCICGIEMQLMGCNITTIKHPAYLDTVMNKDYLYEKEEMLTEYVIRRLKSPIDNYNDLYNFVASNFGVEGNIQRWENLLLNVDMNSVDHISNHNYQYKVIKDILFKLKRICPLLRIIPPVQRVLNLYHSKLR